jgi:hypothetical protein
MLVELFPSRIRYTSMSLPYHIGNGWFGGFLPTTAFAMVAATGDIYYGLWYPMVVVAATFVVRPVLPARNVPAEHRRLILDPEKRRAFLDQGAAQFGLIKARRLWREIGVPLTPNRSCSPCLIPRTSFATRSGIALDCPPGHEADEAALTAFFDKVSDADRRFRFFSAAEHVSHDQLVPLISADHFKSESFLAFDGDQLVASALLASDAKLDTAEIAVSIRERL